MSTDPCCPLQVRFGWVPGVVNVIVHDSINPEAELHQAVLLGWHVSMMIDCVVYLLKPTTDTLFEPGYLLTQVYVIQGENQVEVSLGSVIAPSESAIYHFYYTGILRTNNTPSDNSRFLNPEAFGTKPNLGFR